MTRSMSAAPLVCLHGFTGTPDTFAPLGFEPLWAPRLTGHGPDPHLSSGSFSEEVQRVAAGIQTRATEPVHLLGYSMGARVGLGLLQSFPHLFAQATLVGVNPGLECEEARQERLNSDAHWIDILEQDGIAPFEKKWRAQALFRTQRSIPRHRQDAQRRSCLSHTAAGLAHALRVLGLGSMPNYWGLIKDMKTPLTLVYGELDEKFAQIAQRAQTLSPLIRGAAIPRVGHNPFVESPNALAELLVST